MKKILSVFLVGSCLLFQTIPFSALAADPPSDVELGRMIGLERMRAEYLRTQLRLNERDRLNAEALREQTRLRNQPARPSAPQVPVDITNAEYQKGAVAMLEMRNSTNVVTGLGAGTVIGCSPSTSQPGQYACFVVTAAHVLASRDRNGNEIYPQDITMFANFYVDNKKTVKNEPVTIIGIDKKNDVALGIIFVDYPLPSLPLAPRNYIPSPGERIIGLGCPAGSPPREYTGGSWSCLVAVEGGRIMTNTIPYPADSGGPLLSRNTCMIIGSCTGFEVGEGGRGIFPQTRYVYDILANSNYRNEVLINQSGYMVNRRGLVVPNAILSPLPR